MNKHLLGLVWGLPASFALPSVSACRRALVCMRPRLAQLRWTGVDRRHFPRTAVGASGANF
ncbi:MAG TPA: hypothetical protein VLD35_14800 [Caldimonas sp.]|nr:hypothetical protein [Caldimonas sp.]